MATYWVHFDYNMAKSTTPVTVGPIVEFQGESLWELHDRGISFSYAGPIEPSPYYGWPFGYSSMPYAHANKGTWHPNGFEFSDPVYFNYTIAIDDSFVAGERPDPVALVGEVLQASEFDNLGGYDVTVRWTDWAWATLVIDTPPPAGSPITVSLGDVPPVAEGTLTTTFINVPVFASRPLATDETLTVRLQLEYGSASNSAGDMPAGQEFRTVRLTSDDNGVLRASDIASYEVFGDQVAEPNETFRVKIVSASASSGADVQKSDEYSTITILDDDAQSKPPVSITYTPGEDFGAFRDLLEADIRAAVARLEDAVPWTLPSLEILVGSDVPAGTAHGGTSAEWEGHRVRFNDEPRSFFTQIPLSLYEHLTGRDANGAAPDFTMNFPVAEVARWYAFNDSDAHKIDSTSAITHELMHGLGFGGPGDIFATFLDSDIWHRLTQFRGGQSYFVGEQSLEVVREMAQSGEIAGGWGERADARGVPLTARLRFEPGIDHSDFEGHLLQSAFPHSLMHPQPGYTLSETNLTPSPLEIAMLEDMGWGGGLSIIR